jgi:uncharacterized membrane protein YwzB
MATTVFWFKLNGYRSASKKNSSIKDKLFCFTVTRIGTTVSNILFKYLTALEKIMQESLYLHVAHLQIF